MASLSVTFPPADGFTHIEHRATDDLPPHVKGTAYWVNHSTRPSGYYYEEPNQEPVPVEFINDAWYILHFISTERIYGARASYRVNPNDPNVGLGRWNENDPANPNHQPHRLSRPVTKSLGIRTRKPTNRNLGPTK